MRGDKGTMPLSDLLVLYIGSRDTKPRYRESLWRTVRKATSAGLTSVSCLETDTVNRFLGSLSTPSATTRANIRRELLTLWRWAFEERLTDNSPLRVMRIRSSSKAPEAWSLSDLSRMLDCAEADEIVVQRKSGMRVCDYIPCWIAVAYDTGLRFSDVLALRSINVRNGFVVTTAQKTNKPATRPLSAYSLQQAERLMAKSPDGSLFAWFLTRRRALLAMRSFLDRHAFVGSSKYLRRSCATYIESQRPGEATRYLQHSATHLARKHYIDESLLSVPSGPPPIRS